MTLIERLSRRIGLIDIKEITVWADESLENREGIWTLSFSIDEKVSTNSLWILTHLGEAHDEWLHSLQDKMIERLLSEEKTSKKRMLLQLLRRQEINIDSPMATKLLDYCFPKINSESEPYAIRCFSLYVAYNICRGFPELLTELELYLDMLSTQSLSPGLKSALRQTRQKISRPESESPSLLHAETIHPKRIVRTPKK